MVSGFAKQSFTTSTTITTLNITLILQHPRANTLPQTCCEELGRRDVLSCTVVDSNLLAEPSGNKF